MHAFWQDIRYGLRMLAKNPAFTAVAVLTLALGIGANTAIFSVINAVLLRMLPVSHAEELVSLRWESTHETDEYLPYPMFDQLRRDSEAFASIFAFRNLRLATNVDGNPGFAAGQLVSGNYFSVLGVRTSLGRPLSAEDDRVPGGHPIAVISYRYWQRQFALDPGVIGKPIVLNGQPFTIIGVTPQDFFGVEVGDALDIWIPLVMQAAVMNSRSLLEDPNSWWLQVMARRKAGVNTRQAIVALNVLYQRLAREQAGMQLSPGKERALNGEKIRLVPASKGLSELRDRFSEPLLILLALVGLLLLIACANLANLALAKAMARQKEMAVRTALGAGRLRLARQLLTESLLVAVLGGILGLLFAFWGADFFIKLLARSGARFVLSVRPDWHVLIFTASVAVLTGIVFGSVPAWKAGRTDANAALQASARTLTSAGTATGRSRWELRKLVVASEVAISLLLLVAAGMLARSLNKLKDVEPGFDRANVLLVSVDPTLIGYRGTRLMNLYKDFTDAVSAVPGVRSATFSALPPMHRAQWHTRIFAQGHAPGPNESGTVLWNAVGPNFFKTLRIQLLQGREFMSRDDGSAPLVAIINETMARFYFGLDSPIGKRLSFRGPEGGEMQIIGVVQDIKYSSLREATPRMMYVPYLQTPSASLPFPMTLLVSTSDSPENYVGMIRDAMRRMANDVPVVGLTTLTEQVDGSMGQERLVAELSSFFGFLALILASVGLYGVLTYVVTRRTGEIGVRIALGARRTDVLRLVLGDALQAVVIGILCGLPLALAFARLISSQLYGISPYDPWSVGIATAVLLSISAIASYIPARRATRVDPIVALRYG